MTARPAWTRLAGLWGIGVAGAALAGALAGTQGDAAAHSEPVAELGELRELVPPYPGTYFYPMGQSLRVDGFTRRLAYGLTRHPPRKVGDHYEALWTAQGFVVERRSGDTEESVTATLRGDPWMRTVIATRAGERTAIVVSARRTLELPEPPEIPVPHFCRVLRETGGRDRGLITETVFLSCDGYPRELIRFYDDALIGAERVERHEGDGFSHLSYSGDGLAVLLTVSRTQLDPPRATASVAWQERR